MTQRVWELLAIYSNGITTVEVGVVIHGFSVLFILLFLRERKKNQHPSTSTSTAWPKQIASTFMFSLVIYEVG